MISVAFIDDEAFFHKIFKKVAIRNEWSIESFINGDDFFAKCSSDEALPFDLVVTDYRLPGIEGKALVQKIRECCGELPIIVLSSMAKSHLSKELQGLLGVSILDKDFENTEDLAAKLKEIVVAGGR